MKTDQSCEYKAESLLGTDPKVHNLALQPFCRLNILPGYFHVSDLDI